MTVPLSDWDLNKAEKVDNEIILGKHNLHSSGRFTDDALIKLFDCHPRECMPMATMGDDPANNSDWMSGTPGDIPGKDILDAIKHGKLWLNLLRLEQNPVYRDMMDKMFSEMQVPTSRNSLTLLVSSPNTQVYYHVDPNQVTLYHIRGNKRIWIYPNNDPNLINQQDLECIFSRESEEEVSFRSDWDKLAQSFALNEGEYINWPQNCPHRVVTADNFNVSLSAVFYTRAAQRKEWVYCANRAFRKFVPFAFRDTSISGIIPEAKIQAFRVLRKIKIVTEHTYTLDKKFQVDPNSPNGYFIKGSEKDKSA
ncbi:hypothetical protein [Pseudobacteriovorax antillogorgiicola]|uniref:JmjC domain-containing protein n=1 Tax=Pseudobacteriovorax antillogorgiicola TaxID=1513793 RepID=A0A1Y6CDF3_9BACT|nr:hypothetical protein [Pseudobacteriovorax antillogorgiicola]TCS47939.1 hypothetical protein EDD56_11950 [Pseudobacteriovorax antillogorgiicola]SMF58054.1 hypothetical protein SAMN06296036_11951 [Pseudobacteriovorax antillogorgiicola]